MDGNPVVSPNITLQEFRLVHSVQHMRQIEQYYAPERLTGMTGISCIGRVDHQRDAWSLGVVIFRM